MTARIALSKKERAEKRRLDKRIFSGKATRKEVLRGFELLNKSKGIITKPRWYL
jgi:hypothetical protein